MLPCRLDLFSWLALSYIACTVYGLILPSTLNRVAKVTERRASFSQDDELIAFWRKLNTFDDDVKLDSPRRRTQAGDQRLLEQGDDRSPFHVQFAPRISQCSPGGEDIFYPSSTHKAYSASTNTPSEMPVSNETSIMTHLRQSSFCDTLGVAPGASLSTIRSAYLSLAKKHHPDAGGDRATFETISQAWTALATPARQNTVD